MDMRLEIRSLLERVRTGTDEVLRPVPESELAPRSSPILSPIVWDLAHVAYYEELWLLRTLGGKPPIPDLHDDVYEALRAEQRDGSPLPSLRPAAARAYADDVHERALELLDEVDLDAPSPLLRRQFVFRLVIQYELQQQETMLQTLQIRTTAPYPVPGAPAPDRAPGGPDEIGVPGSAFVLGAVDDPWAHDSELEPHEVELPPFRIDRAPVTNGRFAEFVEDGGYRSRKLWTGAGWEWRERDAVDAPLYWERGDGGWTRTRFGRHEPVPPDEPIQHVSWHEASAFARWAGKRLPTELEWERAAAWDGRRGKLRYPWGATWTGFEANLDHRRFAPTPVGSFSGGVSPTGCVQMTGDVWEWTSSAFQPYPGFLAFPYPEHSEIYFGDAYRVLKGGSWATDGLLARVSFRRWEPPQHRRPFAGFRCARDA